MRCYAVFLALSAVSIVSTEHIGRAHGDNLPTTIAQLGRDSSELRQFPGWSKPASESRQFALPLETVSWSSSGSTTLRQTTVAHSGGSPTQTAFVPSTQHSASSSHSSHSSLTPNFCQQLTARNLIPSGSASGVEVVFSSRSRSPESYYAAVESCRLSSAESVVSSVQSVLSTLTATLPTTHVPTPATSMPATTKTTTITVSSDGIAAATAVPIALGGLGVAVVVLM